MIEFSLKAFTQNKALIFDARWLPQKKYQLHVALQHICYFHKTIFFSLYTQKQKGRNKKIFFSKFLVIFKTNAAK